MLKRLIFKIIVFFSKEYVTWAYFMGYYDEFNNPVECVKCGCKNFKDLNLDHINGISIESEIVCTKCGNTTNYIYCGQNMICH